MILIYRVLTNLIYPFLFIFVYCRRIINKEDSKRYKEKLLPSYFNAKRNSSMKLIWFHAASIGEFKSVIPIIEKLLINNSNLEILVTTTTLSSGNLATTEFKKFKNVYHRFFPFDVNFLINSFLTAWKPDNIFLVDSEIWPNLILNAKKRQIPLALINARLTAKTFKRWLRFPKTAKKIFCLFDLCLVSNNETKEYLEQFNVKNIHADGNIKLITEINQNKITNVNKKNLLSKRFWVAASIHKGEDLFCLKAHKKIKEKYEDIVTILIPRHIDRINEINSLSNSLNFETQLLNQDDTILENKEVIVINSFGVLQDYFKYAKSVFIGKSILKKFKDDGGQNPIDAAKLNCKIYHGPYVYNFDEIYEIFKEKEIAKEVKTYEELSDNLIEDLKNPLKIKNNNSDFIRNLSQKTLVNTMKNINNFIK